MNSAALAKRLEERQFPSMCTLLAADVESLYPSIDINRGLDALDDALKNSGTDNQTRHLIILLTRWVLLNNITLVYVWRYHGTKGLVKAEVISPNVALHLLTPTNY